MFDPVEAEALLKTATRGEEFARVSKVILKSVMTEDELELARDMIMRTQARVNESDPDFKARGAAMRHEAQSEATQTRAMINLRYAAAKGIDTSNPYVADLLDRAGKTKMDAETLKQLFDARRDELIQLRKVEAISPEQALKKSEVKYYCPICHKLDSGNTLDGVPWCFDCNHRTVPESELKSYNRKYRRGFTTGKKKKR